MRIPSGPERQRALLIVGLLCELRHRNELSEEEMAAKLGFGSAEAMHVQLESWGIPEWLAGPSPLTRRPTTGGDSASVPHAIEAEALFNGLVDDLRRSADDLLWRREHFRGGLFVSEARETLMNVYHRRDNYSEEEWLSLCEELGEDPSAKWVWGPDEVLITPFGASPHPPGSLSELIGAYLAAGNPAEPLVEALHPDPQKADLEGIERRLNGKDGLRARVRQLAALVRGGRAGRGRLPETVDPEQHQAAWYVTQRRSEGAPDEEILHELRENPHLLIKLKRTRPVGLDDVLYLGNLRLSPP